MDKDKVTEKLTEEFQNLDGSLIAAIVHESATEEAARETLAVLNADAQFNETSWKHQDKLDLENALKNSEENYSGIELRNGRVTFKADDETHSDYEDDAFYKDEYTVDNTENSEEATDKAHLKLTKTMKSDLARLSIMYPSIEKKKIQMTYFDCGNDIERAAEELISLEIAEKYQKEEEQIQQHLVKQQNNNGYTSKSKTKLKKVSKREATKLENNIEYLQKAFNMEYGKAREVLEINDYSLVKSINSIESIKPSTSTKAWNVITPSTSKVQQPVIQYSQVASGASNVPKTLIIPKNQVQSVIDSNAEVAKDYRDKAATAFRNSKSNHLYRQVAGYYSEQARKFNDRKMVAVDSQFSHLVSQQMTSHSIDLHGLSYHFALGAVHDKLYNWWQIEQRNDHVGGKINPLKIISGAGRHSAGNIPKIKNGVRKKLIDERWKYQEFDSYFMVISPLK